MNEDQIAILKERINQFIWQNGHDHMTLAEAERAAVRLLHSICPAEVKNENVPGPPDPPRPDNFTEVA